MIKTQKQYVMKTATKNITALNLNSEASLFFTNYPDFETAWNACHRGDWMLWIAKKLDVDLLKLTTAKALCANTVRHLMTDERSKKAVDTALLFGQGLATREELNDAADAAAAAYASTTKAADATTAYAVAYATTAYAVAYATTAYAYADAYAYARNKNRQETADICRRVLTDVVFEAINKIK